MKLFVSIIVLVALISLVHGERSEKQPPQVKVTRAELWYVNPNYAQDAHYEIIKENSTYNDLQFDVTQKQDLPKDVSYYSKTYVTDKSGNNAKLILENDIPICKDSELRESLPRGIVVPKEFLGKKCFLKGPHSFKDMGLPRFDILVPNLEEKGKYYRSDIIVGNPSKLILVKSYWSKWGYLQD